MTEYNENTKIIAFDLDDTLYKEIDFVMSAYHAVSLQVREKYGFENAFNVMEQAFRNKQNPFDALADAINSEINIAALVATYRNHKPNISLSRTAELTLEYLQGEDTVLCLITDGRSLTQRNKIKALGLNRFFNNENISISEEIGAEKTDVLPFKKLMEQYPQAKHFFYVGDNTAKDFFHPNRLGWTTICIEDNGQNIHPQNFNGNKTHNPAIIIDNIYDLLPIVLD